VRGGCGWLSRRGSRRCAIDRRRAGRAAPSTGAVRGALRLSGLPGLTTDSPKFNGPNKMFCHLMGSASS